MTQQPEKSSVTVSGTQSETTQTKPVHMTGEKKSRMNSHKNKKRFTKRSSKQGKNFKKKSKNVKPSLKPVFEYKSTCHSALANKPKTGSQKGKSEDDKHGLGGWRCSVCQKPCKVTRALVKKEEPVAPTTEGIANVI